MKILVVVDMQNDFITGSLGTEEAVKIVDRVAEKMENFQERSSVPEIHILKIIWILLRERSFR